MPYGYEVANSKLPQAADPIGSLMQGGVQGITLGLGLQRARQDAQTNQLQQQAAQEEIKNKELDMLGKAAERIKKAESPILKQFYWDTYFAPIAKNRIGTEIDIPDEYNEKYEDSIKALAEGFKNAETNEEKDIIFGRVLSDAQKRGENLDTLFKYREAVMPKKTESTGSLIYLGQQDGSATLMNNKTGEMRSARLPGNGPLMPKNVTNEMSNSSLFATRANDANQQLNGLIEKGFDPTSISAGVQKLLPNYFQGENAQALEQIGRNFGAAVLRKESGAAITKEEWAEVKLQYIPQPGDKPETLKQKEINRARAIQGLGYMGGQLPELKNNFGAIKFDDSKEKRYQEWKQKQSMGK